MSLSVIAGDFRTGDGKTEVPYLSCTWTQRRNMPDVVTAKVDLADPDVQALGLRNVLTPGKAYLAIREGDWFAGGGKVGKPIYNRDDLEVTFGASGPLDHFKGRTILPVAAYSADPSTFLIPDPLEPTRKIPNPAYGTYLSGWERGSIIAQWLTQAVAAPGGNVPIVIPSLIAGAHEKNVEAVDFLSIYDGAIAFTKMENGPDIAFPMEFRPDRLGVRWRFRHGTDAQPKLQSTSIHSWDVSAANSAVRRFRTEPAELDTGSVAWFTGGRTSDELLIARAVDSFLTDAGFPLQEIVDSSHSDVIEPTYLASLARESLRKSRLTPEVWTFEVKKDEAPKLGEYAVGDLCRLALRGDPWIPDSPPTGYLREIAGLEGDQTDWVTVTTTEA